MSLPMRPFASTGKNVSVLGLGTVKFGRNQGVKYPGGDGFALPTDKEIENILDLCIDQSINLIDTAPAYGTSEERLGNLMGARRHKFFLVTKTGEEFIDGTSAYNFTAEHTRSSVERSLKRLKTDYLDCVLLHSHKADMEAIKDTPAIFVLADMKEAGMIGSFGVSTYTVEGGRTAVDLCDAVMVAYNTQHQDERAVIDYAHKKGKAVLVKKGLASGHVGNLGNLAENIRFVTDTPGVTSMVFGSLNPQNILSNINALLKA